MGTTTTTVVTTTTKAEGTWLMGAPGESCTNACSAAGKTCIKEDFVSALDDQDSGDEAKELFASYGHDCKLESWRDLLDSPVFFAGVEPGYFWPYCYWREYKAGVSCDTVAGVDALEE